MSTEVGTLQASLNLDIRSFAEGVSEAVNLAKSLGSTLRAALGDSSQGFSSLLREASAVREEVERLRAELKALNAELNQAGTPEAFTQVQQHTSRLRDDLASAAGTVNQLSGAATGAEQAMSGVGGEAQRAYLLVDATTGEVISMTDAARQAASATGEMASEAGDAASQLRQAAGGARETARETKQAGKEARRTGKETNSVKNNLQHASSFAKDLKRIIAGIVISQAFYEMLNVMNELVRGSIKFANNMDQAQIAFKYLLGDATQATAMVNALQDFAIRSPLDTTAVMASTRKLMAMGFTAKSVIPTLQVLADTAAVFTSEAGDMTDMISHITLALGQMRASGKVMTQELRQLYNAGVPVFQILQEELGLTADQVRNIGKLGIDSGTAVIALLKGLQKRYAGAADEFTRTIPGALEVIKDSVFVLFEMLSRTPRNALKEWLNGVAQAFEAFVIITRNYGLGGLFQALFPPELHAALRNIIGSLQQLGAAFAVVGRIARDTFGNAIKLIVQVLGFVLPPITTFINALAQVIQWLYVTIPFVRQLAAAFTALIIVIVVAKAFMMLWKVLKIGTILLWIKNAVIGVGKALISMAKTVALATAANWKLVASLLAIVAVLALILAFSQRARDSVKKVADAFRNIGVGFDPGTIAQPEFNPPATGDFEDGGLGDIIGDVEDLGDAADSTNKKLKKMFNQSFDEVFLIDDQEDTTLGGIADMDLSDILSGLDDLLGKVDDLAMSGDFWEDWGNLEDAFGLGGMDFSDQLTELGGNFWEAVKEAFSAPEWVGAGIGAALGAVIGGLLGGPAGAKIGAAIGALAGFVAGLYWDDVVKFFESVGLNETTALATAIAVPLGAAIGFKVGGPIGALVGAAIGFLVSWIIGEITEGLETGDWTDIGKPIGIGLGAGIGFLVGGPLGALIGGAIGALVGWIVDMFIDGFTNNNWNPQALGGALGTGIGAAIGMIVGGPAGAAIGAAIGALVGWLVGLIVDNWDAITAWFGDVGKWFGDLFSDIGEWFGKIGKAIGDFFGDVGKWFSQAWTDLKTWVSNVLGAIGGFFSGIGTWFSNIGAEIGKFFSGVWKSIGDFFSGIWQGISEFFTNIWNSITEFLAPIGEALNNLFAVVSGVFKDIWNAIVTVVNDIKNAVVTVFTEIWSVISEIFSFIYDLVVMIGTKIWNAVSAFFTNIWNSFTTWLSDIWNKISTWFNEIWTSITTWLGNIWNSISTWFSDVWNKFTTWLSDIWIKVSTWFSEVWTGFTTWLSDIWNSITTWFSDIWNSFTTWLGDIWNKFTTWFSEVFNKVAEFFGNIFNKIGEFFSNIWNKISTFFSEVWNKIVGFFSDIFNKVRDFVADVINAFANFISNLWTNIKNGVANIYNTFKNWISDLWNNVFGKFFGWIKDGIDKLREFFGLSKKAEATPTPSGGGTSGGGTSASSFSTSGFDVPTGGSSGASLLGRSTPMSGLPIDGHKDGGIFNKEHVAWISEDDRAEAVVPLQNPSAMQPFVDTVATGVVSALVPFLVQQNNNDQLPPVYVGTLIADDRGLKELERKLRIIRVKEERRGS
jgi:tape measure domain-containing protein